MLRVFNPLSVRERASWHFLLWEGLRPSENPEKVWEHVPGYRRKLVGYRVAINSLGFRGEEVSPAKPPGCWRLLALGDSMTFGMSGRQEDTYPVQLQDLLRRDFPDRRIEVINAGVLGYTTLQEEALLREALPALQPDLVVLWWFHNDVILTGAANPAPQADEVRYLIGIKARTWKRKLLHAGYELLPCTLALLRAATVGRGEGDRTHFQFDPSANPEGWAANRASLTRIIDLAKAHSTPLIIYTFGRYDAIAAICRERNIPYVTTVERAGREHEDQFAISEIDPHFNREGHAAVARSVLQAVKPFLAD